VKHGIQGKAKELDQILSELYPSSLAALVVMHCPALEVPKSIQNFGGLCGIEFFNSTLIEWSAEAALTNDIQQNLAYLLLVYVNTSKFPDGLVQENFPQTLQDMEFFHTKKKKKYKFDL
jgi:hypothetical protein